MIPSDGPDLQLFQDVLVGNSDAVKAALQAGADVNGCAGQPLPPIAAAAVGNHNNAGIVKILLEQGADPDKPVLVEVKMPNSGIVAAMPGERTLHIAARRGKVKIVRLLLKRSRADSNALDHRGRTPLMATCVSQHVCLEEMVQLLLKAGADPTLAEKDGLLPLHATAIKGHMDLVDMLYSRAPSTLNRCSATGQTPLFLACANGNEGMVSKLLSLGAMQQTHDISTCPLAMAVSKGLVGVVRALMDEGRMKAVGGEMALTQAFYASVGARQARILQLLLTVDGEERKSEWANTASCNGRSLLQAGAAYCYPAAVSILLDAGADEKARDPEGRIARDIVGLLTGREYKHQMGGGEMDRGEEAAVRRMLDRGPAYRARSWAWPSDAEEVDASGSGDGDTVAAAAVLSSPPAMKTPPILMCDLPAEGGEQ